MTLVNIKEALECEIMFNHTIRVHKFSENKPRDSLVAAALHDINDKGKDELESVIAVRKNKKEYHPPKLL